MRLSKAKRQEIVREFAIRHNGAFNPSLFLDEVKRTGKDHPAYGWFEWNRDKAANAYQLEQAREFARDLRVSFTVETVGRRTPLTVRVSEMPAVLSPMAGRQSGGGYVLVDPADPAHLAEHRLQAAAALRQWWARYEGAALASGIERAILDELIASLEAVAVPAAA
jgi:hypothetical protein